MALTEAEKETILLNLESQMSELSRTNQILLDIFRSGGVANADWALLKAELQGWVESNFYNKTNHLKIEGYSPNISLLSKHTKSVLEGTANTYRGQEFDFLSSDNNTMYANHIGISDTHSIAKYKLFRGSSNVELGVYIDSTKSFAYVPTITDFTQNNAAINVEALNNSNNNVVHKTGAETITGEKTFNTVRFTEGRKYVNYAKGDDLPANSYFSQTVGLMDSSGNTISAIQCSLSANKMVGMNLIIAPFATASTTKKITYTANPSGTCNLNLPCGFSAAGIVYPEVTNTYSLGSANNLWSQVFANTGTIQTSDERLKTEIQDIPEAVLRAWGKCNFKQFKFKDAIQKKGSAARIHFGGIAQEFKRNLEAEGVTPEQYAFFCFDKWDEEYKEERVEIKPAVRGMVKVIDQEEVKETVYGDDGTITEKVIVPEQSHMEEQIIEEAQYEDRKVLVHSAGEQYSLRYEELLVLECAYQRWVLKKIADKVGVAI